jgi:hypothetical protein
MLDYVLFVFTAVFWTQIRLQFKCQEGKQKTTINEFVFTFFGCTFFIVEVSYELACIFSKITNINTIILTYFTSR